jgi:hypothetical protein
MLAKVNGGSRRECGVRESRTGSRPESEEECGVGENLGRVPVIRVDIRIHTCYSDPGSAGCPFLSFLNHNTAQNCTKK